MTADRLNPDIAALAAVIATDLLIGQVLVRRSGAGFELRHASDRQSEPAALRLLSEDEIRPLTQFDSNERFRPLKSAPNLRQGWRIAVRDERALGAALGFLYPGAAADWFAALSVSPPVTSYRQFTVRQTGMYRIAAKLSDASAAAVARTCCHKDFCLKRRLWTVGGAASDKPDDSTEKSIIPCLEPCAILLESARKTARLEQRQIAVAAGPPSESAGCPAPRETKLRENCWKKH
jgi:hypothetical protein